ncbi:MAG: hypothetical protein PHF00_11160, partial [Elusimicrobia bacterium]|nr:hypothetical protein [Elusimicrobiota bacterium]
AALPWSAAQANVGGAAALQAPGAVLTLPRSAAAAVPGVVAPALPAGAASVLPAPAAAPAAAPQAEPAVLAPEAARAGFVEASQPRSTFGSLARTVAGKLGLGRLFDNARTESATGILPVKTDLPEGLVLDQEPSLPDPGLSGGVFIESMDLPGETAEDIFASGPAVLRADPASEAAVEAALRALVDANPAKYGVPSADLATVHVKRVAGQAHQADTIYALFRQTLNGMEMRGTALSFTIKVIRGQPVVLASSAKLYPRVAVNANQGFSDEQLREKALERLGPVAQGYEVEAGFVERKIVYLNGAWRAANIYFIEGSPVPLAVAVDIATGEAFVWDARTGTLGGEPSPAGRVLGRTTPKGPTRPESQLVARPLPDVNVALGDGKVVVTDSDGKFFLDSGLEGLAAQFKAVLAGKWAKVTDAVGGNLEVSGVLESGKEVTVTFNPEGMNEAAIAQVNGYLLTTLVHDWVKTHGIDDKRIDRAIAVKVNIDDECNAYYTRWNPSLNFFRASEKCVNTSYDTVVMHEYGHFIDDMIGGIVNGGVSEGWGDIFSMFILNNPVIGEHFFKKPLADGRDYIRHGENTYQYKSTDEVHAQGQAWGGFAWKLRKSLMAELGEAAGAALAEALVVPTIFAKAANIPALMAQVLLNDMDANGAMPHEAQIRAAAKAHGVTLPKVPGKVEA